jgi:hypothetical protein
VLECYQKVHLHVYFQGFPLQQCCQRLACVFCQINRKTGRWRKNSAAHFKSCFCWRLQRFLTQIWPLNLWREYSTYTNYARFCEKFTPQKSSAPFLAFLGKSAEYSAASAAHIFMRPLLRFAAEILAGWEHCASGDTRNWSITTVNKTGN